jgi:hypothetical protein
MIDTARDRSAMTSSPSRRQHPIPCPPEHSIAPRVGATAPAMIATIDFDYQRDSGRQEVDDVVPDDRLPANATPSRLPRSACHSRASKSVGLSRISRARTSSCTLRGWDGRDKRTSESAGEVPGRSPPRAGSVTLADHQLPSSRINAHPSDGRRAVGLVCPTTGVKLRGPEGAQRLRALSASMA